MRDEDRRVRWSKIDHHDDEHLEYPWEPDPEYPMLDVFHLLREAKQQGKPFPESWRHARKTALARVRDKEERDAWRYALDSTYGAWERAYLGATDGDLRMNDLNLLVR